MAFLDGGVQKMLDDTDRNDTTVGTNNRPLLQSEMLQRSACPYEINHVIHVRDLFFVRRIHEVIGPDGRGLHELDGVVSGVVVVRVANNCSVLVFFCRTPSVAPSTS